MRFVALSTDDWTETAREAVWAWATDHAHRIEAWGAGAPGLVEAVTQLRRGDADGVAVVLGGDVTALHYQPSVAYGSPPFGFRASPDGLVPDPSEQATLAVIRQLKADGHGVRLITRVLNADPERHPPKRATKWHPQSVARILKRLGSGEGPPRL